MRWRIRWLVLCWTLFMAVNTWAAESASPVRIGLTPVFLDDQTAFVNAWRVYLQKHLKRPVVFVQRASYREITDLMRSGKLDFAWLCGYPYVRNKQHMNLLAVPVYQGKPLYRSYLIVPASDRQTRSIADLRGKVFAFSDPDSNSGYLVPAHELHRLQEKPGSFLQQDLFHLVASQGGGGGGRRPGPGRRGGQLCMGYPGAAAPGTDSANPHRQRIARVRLSALRSQERRLRRRIRRRCAKRCSPCRRTRKGRNCCGHLHLDGFVAGDEHMFDSIARMMRAIAEK